MNTSRRNFIRTAALTAGGAALSALDPITAYAHPDQSSLYVIGPIQGYSPQMGTLVSMLNYNRSTIINSVKNLTIAQLDYLHDAGANTIGALVMHLGATEKYYQINTFEGRQEFNEEEKKVWGAAQSLGDEGRKAFKGYDAAYYLKQIEEVRNKTLAELKKRDDKWLMAVDPVWSREEGESINTYWKWFHVCEHESNHRGQIAFLKGRLPGAKPGRE